MGEAGEVGWPSLRNTSGKVAGREGSDLQPSPTWLESLTSIQPRQERDKMVPDTCIQWTITQP